jgi:DnaJ-class molecular chaperone
LGTSGGKVFRLRGKGLPALGGGGAGDLYATVELALPRHMTSDMRPLYEKIRSLDR